MRLQDAFLSGQRIHLEQDLRSEKAHLTYSIGDLRRDVLFLSNTPPVSGITRATQSRGYDPKYNHPIKVWEERLQQIFSAFSAAHLEYYQIRYIGVADGGREIVRVDKRDGKVEIAPPEKLQRKGDRDYFRATLKLSKGEVYLSEFDLNKERGQIEKPYRPTLRAATPVFDPSGQIFGMIVVNMEARRLLAEAANNPPHDVLTYIANSKGEYLLHPDASRSFGFELGNKENIAADFPRIKTLFDTLSREYFPLQALETKNGTHYVAAERVHFDPREPARFILLAYHLPAGAISQQTPIVPNAQIAVGLAFMLLAGGGCLLALRRLFAPLDLITASADRIAAGEHDVALPHGGSAEINRLAAAFKAMLIKLSQWEQEILAANKELEAKVQERTIGLVQAKNEAEKLLLRNQALMLTSMDGIHVMDMQGNLILANEAFCFMLGYFQEEIPALNVAVWDAQWTPSELLERLAALEGQKQLFETVWRRKDGTRLNVEISASGVKLGEQCFVYASARDITVRKGAEAALKRHKIVIDTAIDGFWIVDARGNLLEANEAYARLSGYTIAELKGMHISQLEAKEKSQEEVGAHIQKVITQGYDRFETLHRHKDGHEIDVEVSVTYQKESQQFFAFCRDITERRLNEKAKLRESDERFRGTLEQAAVGIAHASLDGHFQHVNQKFCSILGYTRDELLTMRFQDITLPDDLETNLAFSQQLLSGEIPSFSMEKRYLCKDGGLIWVNLTVSMLRDDDGKPKFTIGVIEDISERKHSEALVQQFGYLLQNSFDEIYVLDANNLRFILTSEGAESNLGYSSEEMHELALMDLCPSFAEGEQWERIKALSSGKEPSLFVETAFRRKNGTIYPVDLRMQFVGEDLPLFMAVARDITERKAAERRLHDLSTHLLMVREEEKKNIAREIHDELGSSLSALKMDTYWLAGELTEKEGAAPLLQHIESMSRLLDNLVLLARRIITELRPPMLDDLGLEAALEWQAAQFSKRAGIACRVICQQGDSFKGELSGLQTINLFRIFQEALTNVVRHSGASKVEAELLYEVDEVILTITDNGMGLEGVEIVKPTSFGMLGMRERAEQLGGRINFYSPPGGGFSVTAILPLFPAVAKGKA